jgi:hypothetical protein
VEAEAVVEEEAEVVEVVEVEVEVVVEVKVVVLQEVGVPQQKEVALGHATLEAAVPVPFLVELQVVVGQYWGVLVMLEGIQVLCLLQGILLPCCCMFL